MWGVKLASEKEQRQLTKTWTAEAMDAEEAVFTFPLSRDGEQLQPALCVFMSSLTDTILC